MAVFLTATVAEGSPRPVQASATSSPGLRLRIEIISESRPPHQAQRSVVVAPPGSKTFVTPLPATGWGPWIDLASIETKTSGLKSTDHPIAVALDFRNFLPPDWASNVDTSPLAIKAELESPNHRPWPLHASLFGPQLNVLLWRDPAGGLRVGTEADYDRRYWTELAGGPVMAPKHIIVADRFIGGDEDYFAWSAGIAALHSAGANTLLVPPYRALRQVLSKNGISQIGWAVYAPEDNGRYIQQSDSSAIAAWAKRQAEPYTAVGYSANDMAIFALADEPGWYYPTMLDFVRKDPTILERFRAYLRAQGLTPVEVGSSSWVTVTPIGRSGVHDLPSRRLFYWSMRFPPADSALYFGHVTAALEQAFRPNLPIFVNWNNATGRLYVPGPVANNPSKLSADAAMGMHDWFEFGRARAATMLWTEDWFGDGAARQWSYYAARLASAAREQQAPGSPERFGGYIVPRTSTADAPEGVAQRAMALVGHGGKAVQYFWFGPEYNFPGNCYSDVPGALAAVSRANRLIAAGEDLLWPGQPMRSPVAILMPRSAEMWDAQDQLLPTSIQDATETNLNNHTTDYMAEVADLFAALQDADIPVEFVSEDDLTAEGLKPYRVLYVTEPDVPIEGQAAIAAWARAGGTLTTVANAATHDRYDQPFTEFGPLTSPPRSSAILSSIGSVKLAAASGQSGPFQAAFVDLGVGSVVEANVLARLGDGSPAIEAAPMGRGKHIHFGFMPGVSYARLGAGSDADKADSVTLRDWILYPIRQARVTPPVTASDNGVETPVLISDKGAAVTVLNWRGAPLKNLGLVLRFPFKVGSIKSVAHGRLGYIRTPEGVAIHMPLKAVDVLLVRPEN